MKPRVRVVVVTFNSEDIIRDCLLSLEGDFRNGIAEVVVVDNHSSDETVNIINNEFAWAAVIRSGGNLGFGAGNNLGAKSCQPDYLYFLNADARSLSGSIEHQVQCLDNNLTAGIIGPLVLDEAGKKTLSTYHFVTPAYAIWVATGLQRLLPINRTDGRYEIRRDPPDRRVHVDRLLGAAFMMRRDLFVQLGGFDENFFLYSEEEDLCFRTWQAGFEVVFDPGCEVIHLGGRSSLPRSVLGIASASWSIKYFLRKHFNGIGAEIALFIWLVMLAVKWCVTFVTVGADRDRRLRGYMTAIGSVLLPGYYDLKVRPK